MIKYYFLYLILKNGELTVIKRILLSIVLTFLFSLNLAANNIILGSIFTLNKNTTAGLNSTDNFCFVHFDLSWENSWQLSYGPSNGDAAWVLLKFQVGISNPTFTNASSFGTTVSVSSTANLREGMPVRVTSGTGVFAPNTVILSITNTTQFVVSATPSATLSNATIECSPIREYALLNSNGHLPSVGSTIEVGLSNPTLTFNAITNPGVGVFIYRNSAGYGTNHFQDIQLRWNYGVNKVNDNAIINIQLFATEMVYIPGGFSFTVRGGGVNNSFTSTNITTALSTQPGGFPSGQTAPTTNSWPNGYNAGYCMKYEISQGQYSDFLNSLTRSQQINRAGTKINTRTTFVTFRYVMSDVASLSVRNRIRIDGTIDAQAPVVFYNDLDGDGIPNESTDGEWLACNFLSWMDSCAFADFCGLRPMTEMEFEKIGRGDQSLVNGEFAWGSTSIIFVDNITNGRSNTEISTTVNTDVCGGNQTNVQGPLRVGSFVNSTSNRIQSGGTYYGFLDFSDNVWERVVNIDPAGGRGFIGIHCDGILSTLGNVNQLNRPGLVSGQVTTNVGGGLNGGGWKNTVNNLYI
ncbi:MAG: hypothetical protein MUC81_08225 [Bacteroidia bacterium]|jgi:formylglycine-generating enzyme required for sulfatase activity|nr:hypothetical protein [Bacteroidia bacterium]